MSDNMENLINFLETCTPPETKTSPTAVNPSLPSCFSAPLRGRESLDNNPFDSMQKLVNRPDDPFEIVEKEACYKARHHSDLPPVEVRLGNLLSLSDDNLLNDNDDDNTPDSESTPTERIVPKFGSDSTLGSVGSTICHSATTTNLDLDNESPPVSMIKWTPECSGESANSGSASSAEGGTSGIKTRSAVEHRKRLLKLSISNSTFNSPVSRRMPERPNNTEMGFFGASDDDACSPMSALFSKASLHCDEHMLAYESPLKLVGDDDLMSEEPTKQFLDAEKVFDADLEMLKIPMLKELPSPVVKHPPCSFTTTTTSATPTLTQSIKNDKTATAVIGLTDLAAIRAKLRAKREEANNNQDISLLIRNLKALICDIDDGGDNQKKQQASYLLESLSSALATPSGIKESLPCSKQQEEVPESTLNLSVPQPIIRQGTFDMELQENEEKDRQTTATCAGSTVIGELSHMTRSSHSTHSVQSMPLFEDVPDAMIRSSATYDGETAEDKGDLVLPEVVDVFSPPEEEEALPSHQVDVNDIIEQLSKLLEQHQFTQQNDCAPNGPGQTNAPINPTFIVVMNTSSAATHAATEPSAKQRSAYVAQYMESSFNNGSPDLHNSSGAFRRRTQSLSLHDKVKIVQLQMQPPPSAPPLQHATSVTGLEQYESPPMSTSPVDTDSHQFKTPSRMMPPRRNSFSSGTPYTPKIMMSARRANAGATETIARHSKVLTTHHESQQHAAIVRPMTMPHSANLSSFKPDLKKKLKTSTSHDSIMKSSVPLKATIPVKKVAPMLKTSPTNSNLSTGSTASSSARKSVHNSSMHLLRNSGKMSYTSTPMPISRSAGTLEVPPSGYPNACSTPTVHRSPGRRTSASTTKQRQSYISATPSAKPVVSAAAAAGLKRRTLSELRTKSPIKPRVSGIGGSTAATTSSRSRLSLKLPHSTSRFLNKTAQTSTANGRNYTCPRSSTRASSSSSAGVNKNKENKLP